MPDLPVPNTVDTHPLQGGNGGGEQVPAVAPIPMDIDVPRLAINEQPGPSNSNLEWEKIYRTNFRNNFRNHTRLMSKEESNALREQELQKLRETIAAENEQEKKINALTTPEGHLKGILEIQNSITQDLYTAIL